MITKSIALLLAIVGVTGSALSSAPVAAAPALPGEPCATDPMENWTQPERWAWNEICEGRVADFNWKIGLLDPLEPSNAEGWGDERRISQKFLETILLYEPFRSAVPRQGVRIDGAWFPEKISLAFARVDHVVWLDHSRFEQGLTLFEAHFQEQLKIVGSSVAGALNMLGLQVSRSVHMTGSNFEDVYVESAKFGAELNMSATSVSGTLDGAALKVGRHLFMGDGAEFGDVRLPGAKVGGQLHMSGVKVSGALVMHSLEVGSDLYIGGGAEFGDVVLAGTKIGGLLEMSGAKVSGAAEMYSLEVGSHLFMGDGAEFGSVDLSSAKVGGQLAMRGAKVSGALVMDGLEVGSDLYMGDGAEFTYVRLPGAKVGALLDMSGAKVSGALIMHSLETGSHFYMRGGAEFMDVDLGGTKVGGLLQMSGAKVSGALVMDGLEVGSDLYIGGGAEFVDVMLPGAKVGGQLHMSSLKVSGALVMDSLEVGSDLSMGEGAEFSEVDLLFANIGSNLDLSGATLKFLDLSGSKIGELRLGSGVHPSTKWRDGGLLVLRNAEVDALQDRLEPDPWPSEIVLDGFVYRRLGGLSGSKTEANMLTRSVGWFTEWLARDKEYSTQPYQQLAGVLRVAGENRKADAVLYAGWEREREKVEGSARWWALTLLKYTIGYGLGYRYFWTLFWVGGFVLIGVAVLWRSGAIRSRGLPWTFACSLDLLLPIVKLNECHGQYVQQMGGWGAYYFYAHKIVGWILASFLIAGLSGVTEL